MKKIIKNILKGAGSILFIAPPRQDRTFTRKFSSVSVEDALRGDWEKVGQALNKSIESERTPYGGTEG